MIEVYHNTEFLLYMVDPTIEALKKGHFERVADVETEDLDYAYQETQNIDQPWHRNTNVKAVYRENRSTYVGDLIKKGDTFHVVESCGFRELTKEEECELTLFIPDSSAPPENPTPLQWKEYGVPGIESLIKKGYKYVVQFNEGDKRYGDPLTFKNVQDISSFMRTYPQMKMIWQRAIQDHLEILTDRPGVFKQYE